MRIVENEAELSSNLLREVLAAWRSCSVSSAPPPSTFAGPEFYEAASPWLAVVAVRKIDQFEILLCSDGAGRLLPSLGDPGSVAPPLRRWWMRTVQARKPVRDQRNAPKTSSDPGYEAIALPFLGMENTIDRVLCYVVPQETARESPPVWRPGTRSNRRIDD